MQTHMNKSINRYLSGDPIAWLTEKSDPAIRYLTYRDILKKDKLENEYNSVLNSMEIARFIKLGNSRILGSERDFDVYYRGAMWCFAESVERGLDKRSEIVERTVDFIFRKAQMDSGGLTINWRPGTELSCRTGDILRYMIKAGFRDERVKKGMKWIAGNQRHDGGWLHCPLSGIPDVAKLMLFKKPGGGLKRESDSGVTSCFYASIACSMALAEYSRISSMYDENIKRAADFFLNRRMYLNSRNEKIRSKKFWNRDFTLLGYPVMSQYDILYGLRFIARTGRISDQRTGDAFNIIMSKQNSDGTWNLENAQVGMMFGNKSIGMGKKSKWVTLNVFRMLKDSGYEYHDNQA